MTAISWDPRLGQIEGYIDDDAIPRAPADMADGAAQLCNMPSGETYLRFVCPCGCREICSIPVMEGEKVAHRWQISADRVMPTVVPSIRRLVRCGWHGFLTVGVWSGQRESV